MIQLQMPQKAAAENKVEFMELSEKADAEMELIEGRWVEARDHYHYMQYLMPGEVDEQDAREAWNRVGSELLAFRTKHGLRYPSDWRTDDQVTDLK